MGNWSIEGDDFCQSKVVKNDKFVDLSLDELNQADLTQERIKAWVAQVKQEFGLQCFSNNVSLR